MLYERTLREGFGAIKELSYGLLGWSDREAEKLAIVLPLCSKLTTLLLENNQLGDAGASILFAEMALTPCAWPNPLCGGGGYRYTMVDSIAERWRRGYRLSDDGVRRMVDISPERLTPAEIAGEHAGEPNPLYSGSHSVRLTPAELAARARTSNRRRWSIYQGAIAKRHPETRRLSIFSVPTLLEQFECPRP